MVDHAVQEIVDDDRLGNRDASGVALGPERSEATLAIAGDIDLLVGEHRVAGQFQGS